MALANGGREYRRSAFLMDPLSPAVRCELNVSRRSCVDNRVISPTCLPSTAITRNDCPRRTSKARASHRGIRMDVDRSAMALVVYAIPGAVVKSFSEIGRAHV